MTFQLHSCLQHDCIELGQFPLSRVLLMNDSQYPWCILVPEHDDIREVFELSEADQIQLLRESVFLSRQMSNLFNADKMNVATIGNKVPQLHIHHIVRYHYDRAWPGPVWGKFDALPYSPKQLEKRFEQIRLSIDKMLVKA